MTATWAPSHQRFALHEPHEPHERCDLDTARGIIYSGLIGMAAWFALCAYLSS